MDVHPYRAAWQTRDLDAWADALAVDVAMYSPAFKTPFRGREAAVELFGVLFDSLGDLEITNEFAAGDAHAFFWRVDAGGRWIEGADLLRSGEDGKITEIRVLIRPLVGIAAFAGTIGPPLAAKRGPLRAALLRLLTLPLEAIMAFADTIASRLVQRH